MKLIQLIVPLRVSRDEELVGLDVGIHGVPAYSQEDGFLDLEQLKKGNKNKNPFHLEGFLFVLRKQLFNLIRY